MRPRLRDFKIACAISIILIEGVSLPATGRKARPLPVGGKEELKASLASEMRPCGPASFPKGHTVSLLAAGALPRVTAVWVPFLDVGFLPNTFPPSWFLETFREDTEQVAPHHQLLTSELVHV